MTVGELLERISSAELTEWQAYFRLEQEGATPSEEDQWRKAFSAYG